MKKMIFILNNMNVGGTEKAFLYLMDSLSQYDYDVTLLLLEKTGGFLEQVPNRIHIDTLEDYGRIKNEILEPPLTIIKSYLRDGKLISAMGLLFTHLVFKMTNNRSLYYKFVLRGIKKRFGFDEIHAYAGPFDFISALAVHGFSGGKKIQWIHFDVKMFNFNIKTCRTLYREMDEVRVVSREALESLVFKMPDIINKAVVSPNIVSRDLCSKLAEVGDGFNDFFEGVRIVTIGRLSEEKGQDIIPEIAVVLKNKGYSFRWYLIGDGVLRETIEKRIVQLDLQDNIRLLGTIKNPYLLLKEADVYVQTSIHEGFCLTLSEALVFNLPIVSTDCAGAHEQLDGHDDCMIVKRDICSIIKAVEKIIKQNTI